VGLTPMVAMLEALVDRGVEIPVQYIHGTHNRDTHAMRDHVRRVAAQGRAVAVTDFHQTPLADEVAGRDYDNAGIIADEWLVANTPVAEADYYICGPRPFLRHAVSTLSLSGVPSDRIHYEFFGPADELLAA
ncbi:MAG TPA: nitric oxide dioxygenase, partial [Croceicoccus sp.]|nr:nitric oxide dioxygenase [Croceicoccus sp.]